MRRQVKRQNGTGLAIGIAVVMVVAVAVWIGYVVNHNANERQRQEQADQKERQIIAEFQKSIPESEMKLEQLRARKRLMEYELRAMQAVQEGDKAAREHREGLRNAASRNSGNAGER